MRLRMLRSSRCRERVTRGRNPQSQRAGATRVRRRLQPRSRRGHRRSSTRRCSRSQRRGRPSRRAVIAWLRIGFLRGSITVDDYLGSVYEAQHQHAAAAAGRGAAVSAHIARALELAEAALQAHGRAIPRRSSGSDPSSACRPRTAQRSRARSWRRSAPRRRAYDAHEKVLELDPSRKDAGLIVGTYRYIVSALSMPVRLMAYVAGFGGGKERGLRMIEEAAALPGTDADRCQVRACCCSTTASAASTMRCVSLGSCSSSIRATVSSGTRPAPR